MSRWNNRYDFIEEGLQYLHHNDRGERDNFGQAVSTSRGEANVANNAVGKIEYNDYNRYRRPFNDYNMNSVKDAGRNIDYDPAIHGIQSYRFGKALQAFTGSACPTTRNYTPIMYDARDTTRWPWEANPRYEDPIVDPSNGNIYCCDKGRHTLDLMYVKNRNARNKLFRNINCGGRHAQYKQQENSFVDYINTYAGGGPYDIFQCINLLTVGVNSVPPDPAVVFLALQTYHNFFRNPLRIAYFNDCVCRGDAGHANIQGQIEEIKRSVDETLSTYGMTEAEKAEIIGEDGILTNLAGKIDTRYADWKENTLQALRRWISFNVRISHRIEREDPTERLRDKPFYQIIKYVIVYLLENLAHSPDNIALLQLLPITLEPNQESIGAMVSFGDEKYLDIVLSYLVKERASRGALLDFKDRLKFGLRCNPEEIYNLFTRLYTKYPLIVKLLLRNLIRDNGGRCKEDLQHYFDVNIKEPFEVNDKEPVIQIILYNKSSEFQSEYNEWDSKKKDAWLRQALIDYIDNEDKCKRDLQYYFDVNIKAPIIDKAFKRKSLEFQREYKERWDRKRKDAWKDKVFLDYIEEDNAGKYNSVLEDNVHVKMAQVIDKAFKSQSSAFKSEYKEGDSKKKDAWLRQALFDYYIKRGKHVLDFIQVLDGL